MSNLQHALHIQRLSLLLHLVLSNYFYCMIWSLTSQTHLKVLVLRNCGSLRSCFTHRNTTNNVYDLCSGKENYETAISSLVRRFPALYGIVDVEHLRQAVCWFVDNSPGWNSFNGFFTIRQGRFRWERDCQLSRFQNHCQSPL